MNDDMQQDQRRTKLIAAWERHGTLSGDERNELLALLDASDPADRGLARLIRRDLSDPTVDEVAEPNDRTEAAEARVDAIMERVHREAAGAHQQYEQSSETGPRVGRSRILRPAAWSHTGSFGRTLQSIGAAAAGLALLIGALVLAVSSLGSVESAEDGNAETVANVGDIASTDTDDESADSPSVVVRFELVAPEAGSVSLVGDFNDWDDERHMLRDRDQDGVWEIEVPLQRGNVYTYNFLINGNEWIPDPSAVNHIEDLFGGEKSVLNL